MRYDPDHKTRTRDRIVRNAARKLRAEGLSSPGVASLMKASGLTVGGFYKHFRSKDELFAKAIAQAFSHRRFPGEHSIAIDSERVSNHKAGTGAAKPEHSGGDLLRPAQPTDRLFLQDVFHRFRLFGDHGR